MTLLESLVSTHDFSVRGNPDFMMRDYVSFDVEVARDVVAWQSYKPLGDRKVAVIRADFMTHNAQNALLKTLEEPVEYTHLFLVVPKPEMLLPTLLSRVQILGVGSESSDSVARDFIAMPVGERVALVGNSLAERFSLFGNFESLLHRQYPDRELVIRNDIADQPDTQRTLRIDEAPREQQLGSNGNAHEARQEIAHANIARGKADADEGGVHLEAGRGDADV